MQGSANLNIMMKTARKAGRSLVKDFREVENLQSSSKAAGDFVTRADIAAEKIIRDELMEARPTYGFLGEEGGVKRGGNRISESGVLVWGLDPEPGNRISDFGVLVWGLDPNPEIGFRISAESHLPQKSTGEIGL
mgnify:CR=1 FL=1